MAIGINAQNVTDNRKQDKRKEAVKRKIRIITGIILIILLIACNIYLTIKLLAAGAAIETLITCWAALLIVAGRLTVEVYLDIKKQI